MAWFFSLPLLEWIKRIRKFRQVLCFRNKVYIYLHCSAEQINAHDLPLTASLPSHPFLQLKEKTSALVLSHAKILFGFSCAPSLHLCIWSKCRTFLSQWVLGKFCIREWSMESVLLTPSQVTVTERAWTADYSLRNQLIGTICMIFDPKLPWFSSGKRKFKWICMSALVSLNF